MRHRRRRSIEVCVVTEQGFMGVGVGGSGIRKGLEGVGTEDLICWVGVWLVNCMIYCLDVAFLDIK